MSRIRTKENQQIENLVMNVGLYMMVQAAAFVALALILGGVR